MADKVTWNYCNVEPKVWSMKALSSENGQISLIGTPNAAISGGYYRINVQRKTPFGDVPVLSYDGDIVP